jgi:hypothetical protein
MALAQRSSAAIQMAKSANADGQLVTIRVCFIHSEMVVRDLI